MASNVIPTTTTIVPTAAPPPPAAAEHESFAKINAAAASATSTVVTENQYFYEDEVYKFDANGRVRFGLVMETYETGGSDMEQSDAEDQLKKREIRVAWHPRGTEEITQEQFVSIRTQIT